MKKSIFIRGLAALVACALVLPVIGSLKNPVERPLKCSGSVNSVVADDGSFAFDNSSGSSVGIATHVGLFTAAASGNAFTGVWTLTLTAANGDQISGVAVPGDPLGFVFTSGTGRFAGVSGGFTYVTSDVSMVTNPDDPTGTTVILSYNYSGTGTITY